MGTIKKIKNVLLFLTALVISSCENVDFSGFFFYTDPVNQRVQQSLECNVSHPVSTISVSGTEYTLLVGGDAHVSGTVVNLDKFIAQANTPGITGMVIVGDLATGNKEDYDIFKQEIDTKNSKPVFLMIGNHDLFFSGWDTYFEYFGSSTYSFTVNTENATDLYICLDTGSGTLGWRQIDWLKNLLEKERKNARYCIVFTHVNLVREHRTSSTNLLVEELRTIIDLCYTYSINMVISGHDHNRAENSFGKTRYITLDALEDNFENASYMNLQVKENGLVNTFVSL